MSIEGEIAYARKVDAGHLESKPYGDPRVFREFTLALELVREHATVGSLLDLGCGSGWTSIMFSRAGYDVTAVDVAPAMIEILERKAREQQVVVDAVVSEVTALDLPHKSFESAVFFDSLHHVPDYAAAIRSAAEHLVPGGLILLFEPSWLHRISPHAKQAAKKYDVTEHGFSRRELRIALREAGFVQIRQHHDPGTLYRGPIGFAHAMLRMTSDFITAFPQMKRIVTAHKAPV